MRKRIKQTFLREREREIKQTERELWRQKMRTNKVRLDEQKSLMTKRMKYNV